MFGFKKTFLNFMRLSLFLYSNCLIHINLIEYHRWALKEATIKAHSYRRLYLSQISILSSNISPPIQHEQKQQHLQPGNGKRIEIDEFVENFVQPGKPTILVDPPITDRSNVGKTACWNFSTNFSHSSIPILGKNGASGSSLLEEQQRQSHSELPAEILVLNRQRVDGSLSHDGEYAFAVVQALDEEPMLAENGQ